MLAMWKFCNNCFMKSGNLAKNFSTTGIKTQFNKIRISRVKYYLEKDNIPENFDLIYRAPMEYYLSVSKNVTTITAGVIALLAAYKYRVDSTLLSRSNDEFEFGIGALMTSDSDLYYFAGGFVLITLAVRYIIMKYPLRIYKDIDRYIAVFEGQIPFQKSKLMFRKGEVTEGKSSFLNPWQDITYKLRDTQAILFEDYFKTPSELHQMLRK